MTLQPIETKVRPAVAGKVVIVTGASSGIGEATAREFGLAGAKVVLAARRVERLHRLAGELRDQGRTALVVPTDLTQIDQIKNLVHQTLETFGRIDVLANIAGWGRYDWIDELSVEDLRQQYEVNVLGTALLTREVVPQMKTQRSGVILNMASYASKISVPPLSIYSSTKYAIEGLTDALRRELSPWGINVIRIHPSAVTGTEFNQKARQGGGIKYTSFPVGRISREHLAREIVGLVERPRRSILLSRLYDPAVVLDKLFPELVDFITGVWVRHHLRKEGKSLEGAHLARYHSVLAPWQIAAGMLLFVLLRGILRKR